MSAPTVTEREAVLRERAAFEAGYRAHYDWLDRLQNEMRRDGGNLMTNAWNGDAGSREANLSYPIPTVTRPRVVKDSASMVASEEWCVIDGTLRLRVSPSDAWMRWAAFQEYSVAAPLPHRVALWANLFASPDETVEVEA